MRTDSFLYYQNVPPFFFSTEKQWKLCKLKYPYNLSIYCVVLKKMHFQIRYFYCTRCSITWKLSLHNPVLERHQRWKKRTSVTLHSKIKVVFTVYLVLFYKNKPKRAEMFLLRDNSLLLPEAFNICPHILSGLFVLSLLFCQSSQHRAPFSCGKAMDFGRGTLKINFDYISTKILDFFFHYVWLGKLSFTYLLGISSILLELLWKRTSVSGLLQI